MQNGKELEPSEVVEAHDSATVHGIIAEASPVKSAKKRRSASFFFRMVRRRCDW